MDFALELAERGARLGEVPVGAVIVRDGQLIGSGFNRPISACDPSAHAEILALRDAATAFAEFAVDQADRLETAEINPLILTAAGEAIAADAVIQFRIAEGDPR